MSEVVIPDIPTKRVPEIMVVVPPPFIQCFGHHIPAAGSPLIVSIFGHAGVGKSHLAAAIASQYRRAGWYALYSLIEPGREHTAVRHQVDVDRMVYVPLEEWEKHIRFVVSIPQKLIWVIDSVAVLGSNSERIGARRHEINKLNLFLLEARKEIPTIVLLIAQGRQGASVPGNPNAVSMRPSFAKSNEHTMHLSVSLSRTNDGKRLRVDFHSLSLFQIEDGKIRPEPMLENFACQDVRLSSYDFSLPPILFFQSDVDVFAPEPYESESGEKKRGRRKTKSKQKEDDSACPHE